MQQKQRMGWMLALLLAGLMIGALAVAGNAPVLERIQQRGELILGTSANMPPMTQREGDGRFSGFDIDLARAMASLMEVRLTIKVYPFPELLPALQRGEVDVVISNMTMTARRNLKVAFVGPYMTSGKCIVTKDQTLARASEQASELNVTDTRIAVLKGSTSEEFAQVLFSNATLVPVDDHAAGAELVKSDQAGGMLTDYPICLSTLAANPDAGFTSIFSLLSYEPIGIALPAGDPLLVNWTENFLQRMEATDTFKELSRRWFGKFEMPR